MRAAALAALVGQNVRRARRSFVLSVLGIAVGVSSLTFFLALSAGVRGLVLGKVFPVGQIEVVPPSTSLDGGPLSLLSLGGGAALTEDRVAQLRAQPGVRAAFRRLKLAFPARAWGGRELFGRDVYAELIADGVDAAAMSGESLAPEPFSDDLGSQTACASDADCRAPEYCPADTARCERPVPAVLSPFMLEVYNGGIAPSHGLPKVGSFLASRFRGFTFNIELGRSMVVGNRPLNASPRVRRVMLVGISRHAAQLAVTLPLGFVQAWNRDFTGASPSLSSVALELSDGADVTRLAATVRALGLEIADAGAERAGLAITLLTLLFALVSFAIVGVAAVNIAHSFFRAVAERRRELGVLRSVGASRRDLYQIVLGEAAAIGLAGGAVGLVLARAGALAVDGASQRFVPDFPFKPDSYFSFEPWIVVAALGCAMLACVAGAYLPARAAARLEPSEALSAP